MAAPDRRGRAAHADTDLRRRPSDGFRARDGRRFAQLVQRALARVDEDLRAHVIGARLDLRDVPDPDGPDVTADGDVVLARLALPQPGRPAVLTVFRRPLELRAEGRRDLSDAVAAAITDAVTAALGLPPRDEEDDEDG